MSELNPLAQLLLSLENWSERHVITGCADAIPEAIRLLATAVDDEALDQAYWRLDNNVVVQGRIFDSALALVPVLLSLLAGKLRSEVRVRTMDLLFEIHGSDVHEEEEAWGNITLGIDCSRAVEEGLWLYYVALGDSDANVRRTAIDLVGKVESNQKRRQVVLTYIAANDSDESVRLAARWWSEH